MDLKELKQTDIWKLYEQGRNYMRMRNIFTDTDKNYRFYNGNQWEGAKIEGIEQAQFNFIMTIVDHKTSSINANLWAINYSSENYENKEFRKTAEDTCDMLNRKAAKVWEKDNMDLKIRETSEDAAINDEAIIYVDYDKEKQNPVNEILNKNDIQYGNENSPDIQTQPFIIIKQRMTLINAIDIAKADGVSEDKIALIGVDKDYFEEAGDDAKYERQDMVTVVTKMWREKGTIHYAKSVKYTEIKKDTDTRLTYYPVAHFNWRSKKGSSRGEGEVRYLIPNQIELNKTLARMLLSVKQNSYPQKVIAMDKIQNPNAVNQIGGIIKTKNNMTIDDVNKIFGIIPPAAMSGDVQGLITNLISITRELRNAGDMATGGVDPEKASGKAILAVQQAMQQPLIKQLAGLKKFIEDLARIWLDMWITYTPDGLTLEQTEKNPQTGEEITSLVKIPSSVMENLQADVKIDITPKGAFDKFAQESSIENLFTKGMFSPQMLPQLKIYANALSDDSVMPKQKLLDIIEEQEEEQKKIAQINAQAQMLKQRAMQFINSDPAGQARLIDEATQNVQNIQPQEAVTQNSY